GHNDLSASTYEAISPRRVRVRGSRWVPSETYGVKLEGAGLVGFRSICLAGIRDPALIAQLDMVIGKIRHEALERFRDQTDPGQVHLISRVYGRDAVMGAREPM